MEWIYALVAAISCIENFASLKQREQQEKIMKARQEGLRRDVLRQTQRLYEIKKSEEKKVQELLVKEQEENNSKVILEISKNTEQYTKWPLKVPPLCLMGTASQLPPELRTESSAPLYVMVAPGSTLDRKTHQYLEERLEEYVGQYFSDATGTRIVMLRDCWVDQMERKCDEIVARNIQSLVPDVAMLIFYPVKVGEGKIEFASGYWNIAPASLNDKGKPQYFASFDRTLSCERGEQAAETLAITVTMLADMYGWSHYRYVPRLLQLASEGALAIAGSALEECAEAYVRLFGEMVRKGLLSPLDELDECLAYCEAVDQPEFGGEEKTDTFRAFNLFDSAEESTLACLPEEHQEKVWAYVNRHPAIAHDIDPDLFNANFTGWLRQKVETESERRIDRKQYRPDEDTYDQILSNIEASSLEYIKQKKRSFLLKASEMAPDKINCRKWLTSNMTAYFRERITTRVMPGLLEILRDEVETRYFEEVDRVTSELGDELTYSFIPAATTVEVISSYKREMKQAFSEKIRRVDIGEFSKQTYYFLLGWVEKIAKRYIDRKIFGVDVVRVPSKNTEIQEEDRQLLRDLSIRYKDYFERYAKEILGEGYQTGGSYDSSSDSSDFFDTVVMTPSF